MASNKVSREKLDLVVKTNCGQVNIKGHLDRGSFDPNGPFAAN
jgi:hypothetical protein